MSEIQRLESLVARLYAETIALREELDEALAKLDRVQRADAILDADLRRECERAGFPQHHPVNVMQFLREARDKAQAKLSKLTGGLM